MTNAFDWVEIRTNDVREAAHFYEQLFGWRVVRQDSADGYAVWIFDTGGRPSLENLRRGGIWERPAGEPLGLVVYVAVADIEAVLERATELGGRVVTGKTQQGSAYRAYIADPSGNLWGLWEEDAQVNQNPPRPSRRSQVPAGRGRVKRPLVEAALAYAAFCALSLASRFVLPLFAIVVLVGIAFPLIWGRVTGNWESMGFARQRVGSALAWGAGAGLVGILYLTTSAYFDPFPKPPLIGLQFALGIPVAALLLSPCQEFFFRAWLQPRLEVSLGQWVGLLTTSLAFAAWHLLPPFEGTSTSTVEIATVEGILTTTGMGLLFGYVFRRTGSIVAPWLAHLLWIIALIGVGGLTIVQVTP